MGFVSRNFETLSAYSWWSTIIFEFSHSGLLLCFYGFFYFAFANCNITEVLCTFIRSLWRMRQVFSGIFTSTVSLDTRYAHGVGTVFNTILKLWRKKNNIAAGVREKQRGRRRQSSKVFRREICDKHGTTHTVCVSFFGGEPRRPRMHRPRPRTS